MMRLEGRTVIITGASRCIGAATTHRLHNEGAELVLASRHHAKLEALAEGLDTARTMLGPGDLSNPETCMKLVEEGYEAFGRVDGLVNNAWVACEGSILDDSFWDDWRGAFAINTEAAIHTRYITTGPVRLERFIEHIPLRRAEETEGVANAIACLTSDDARSITRSILPVDGGLTASSEQPVFTTDSGD